MEFRRVLFRSSLQRDLCFEMSQNTGAILIARAPLAPPWVLSFAFHDLYLPQDRSSVTSFYRIGKPPPPAAESREGTLCRLSADRKSVVSGKRVSVRVELGGGRVIKKKKK